MDALSCTLVIVPGGARTPPLPRNTKLKAERKRKRERERGRRSLASRPEIQILWRLFPAYFPTGGNPVNSLITRPASKRTKKGSHRRRRRCRRCGTRCIVLLAGLMDEHPGSMGWRAGGGSVPPCAGPTVSLSSACCE